jgi:HK97 family phage major capsid protein
MAATRTVSPDELRARFRAARNRRQFDEVRHETARAIRQVAGEMDESEGDGGSNGELSGLFAQLRGLLDEIDGKISRQAVIDDLDTRAARGPRDLDRSDRGFAASLPEFSIRGMLAAAIGSPIPGLDLGRSIEITQELRRRTAVPPRGFWAPLEALYLRADYARALERRATISTGLPAGGPGGNLIPLDLDAARYIDALRARTVVVQAGAQTINDLVGNLDIPRMSQTGQVSWFQEGDTISQSQEEFDRVSFRPKHCGAIISYSRNMLLQSTPSIEMIIRDDLSRLLALDMDRVALTGSGQGAEPLGIIRNTNIPPVSGTQFTYLNNVAMRQTIAGKNVPIESLAWVGNSTIDAYSLSVLDGLNRPLGKQLVYLGYPDFVSNIVTAAAVTGPPALPAAPNPQVLGAFSDLYITYWSQLDLLANALSDTAFTTASVQVRALLTADVNVRHPASFTWANIATGPPPPTVMMAAAPGPEANGGPRVPRRN